MGVEGASFVFAYDELDDGGLGVAAKRQREKMPLQILASRGSRAGVASRFAAFLAGSAALVDCQKAQSPESWRAGTGIDTELVFLSGNDHGSCMRLLWQQQTQQWS